MTDRIRLFDTTLRDGRQMAGVDFNIADKIAVATALDGLGIDYVEGGWPGANPTDDAFFRDPPKLSHARLTAFGMTRRPGRSAANDPGLAGLADSRAPAICLVGKTWDFHVDVAFDVSHDENLAMIGDSVGHLGAQPHVAEMLFDAEHFFDGWKANPDYAHACLRAACDAGATTLVLCDTNGGTLPHEVRRIAAEVVAAFPGVEIGIHAHDDTANAVANSLAAVEAGARHVQGTLNGLGERCGNADLVAILPSLTLKMGFETGCTADKLTGLTRVSQMLDARLERPSDPSRAYVGAGAFTHKGGLHVSAVEKDPATYEHVDPALVGNRRTIVVSDQAGRSNVLARLREGGLEVPADHPKIGRLVEIVKARETAGLTFDGAEASFELLARRELGQVPVFYALDSFRVLDERRVNARGEEITLSEATVKITVGGERYMEVAEGNGPVSALDRALRKVLVQAYPALAAMELIDYKVRILTPKGDAERGTNAVTRVTIESRGADGATWRTVGVSPNVIDASYRALEDAIVWKLLQAGAEAPAALRVVRGG